MAKTKKSSNSKKGPKAWGKNLYGEDGKHDCKKVHPDDSHKEWEKKNVKEEDHHDKGKDDKKKDDKKKKLPPWLNKDKDKDKDDDVKEERTEEDTHTTDLNPHQDNDAAGVRTVKMTEKKGKKSAGNSKKGPKAWGKNLYGEQQRAESLNNVQKFIGRLSQKNYAEANKYLQDALENKLKERIAGTQHNLEF